jgi:hypothetical protein
MSGNRELIEPSHEWSSIGGVGEEADACLVAGLVINDLGIGHTALGAYQENR